MAGLADWLIYSEKLSREWSRKLMSSIGLLGPALGLITLTFIGNFDFLLEFLTNSKNLQCKVAELLRALESSEVPSKVPCGSSEIFKVPQSFEVPLENS